MRGCGRRTLFNEVLNDGTVLVAGGGNGNGRAQHCAHRWGLACVRELIAGND